MNKYFNKNFNMCFGKYRMDQRHLASMYGLTKGCQIKFERTRRLYQYTGWLLNTNNSFQFTLNNAKTDSQITIGNEGVFDVQFISRTRIKVSKTDVVLEQYIEFGVITADLWIIPVHDTHHEGAQHQTTNDIVRKLQLDSADGRQRIAKAFKRAGIRTFGLEQDAMFRFRKEGKDWVGKVPRHEELMFTFKTLVYHDGKDKFESLNDKPDKGCIRVILYDGKAAVFGLLERENQNLYRNQPGRIYVDLTLHLSASFGHSTNQPQSDYSFGTKKRNKKSYTNSTEENNSLFGQSRCPR